MSRIDFLIQQHCPNGVEHLPLGEIGEFTRGSGMQKADLADSGIPAIHYGQIHTHYGIWAESTLSFVSEDLATRLRMAEPGDLVIATTSEDDEAVGKASAWLGKQPAAVSGDAFIFRHTLDPKFVSYFFHGSDFQTQKGRYITGAKVRRISGANLAKIRIPVPPPEVQQEIVRTLDKFTQLEAELEAELEARQEQYEHYRSSLLAPSPKMRWTTLGDVSTRVSSGSTPRARAAKYYEGGTIPWLRTNEVRFNNIWDTEMRITEAAVQETAAKWIPENCVIVAISGATAGRSAINKIPLTTNQHCCNLEIDPEQAHYRYVFYWVAANYEELKSQGRGARSDLNAGIIKNFRIPLPSLEEQSRVVNLLDNFDTLVSDISVGLPAEIEARRKQYEYYRDELLTFKELVA